MSTAPDGDTAERFTGLATTYARFRPNYPQPALRYIIETANLSADSLVVDVGCGTGISTRMIAEQGIPVVGIEPNDEMRSRAEAESRPTENLVPRYLKAQAEATTLEDHCADLVLSAQAFHWFATEDVLSEFRRILKPEGWVILMWNERDERDEFTKQYGDVIRSFPDAGTVEHNRATSGAVLLNSPHFKNAHLKCFEHYQKLDEVGVVGRAFSASYAPKVPAEIDRCKRQFQTLFAAYQTDNHVKLCYETSLYCAQVGSVL